MTQDERRRFLLEVLLRERGETMALPGDEAAQRRLLRALCNVREPVPAPVDFLAVQDAYLQEETRRKGVTDAARIPEAEPGIRLWRGDITTLRCDAIVNAANSALLGCFVPCHGCIDNAIHTYAGVQLRLACAELMAAQGHPEPAGRAKITPAFNLPSRYVLHTVGPIVRNRPTARDEALLAACYRSCLALAAAHGARSVAFCCISTGEFHFPSARAAQIAVQTVREARKTLQHEMDVIFNVYQERDLRIYEGLLAGR